MTSGRRTSLRPCAGLVAGPAAWAAATQASQILPQAECGTGWPVSLLLSLAGVLVALAGSFLSFRQFRLGRYSPEAKGSAYPGSFVFVAALCCLVGVAVAFALALQGAAALLVPPCAR